ncbi:F-box domain-containing protein [Meloidogyne graminicola]|uniref:F-box domain-containing protein n=1 Tax=Meloidogyne graminicola TaxID=189291 RepID=A0A8S9ZAD5_9BILA|nr:F-box domain-containing protein [Meloidogyne graminicola]
MHGLPIETILDVLKFLHYNDLIKMKQINKLFHNFITENKDILAHGRFKELLFTTSAFLGTCLQTYVNDGYSVINLKEIEIEYNLNNRFLEKSQAALNKKIPFFIKNMLLVGNKLVEPVISLIRDYSTKTVFILNIPFYPTSIEQIYVVRYWLQKILLCNFEEIVFLNYVWNPIMIDILFDYDEVTQLKFICQIAVMSLHLKDINAWKFTYDRLIIKML